jgi:hypothetical protein
VSASQLTDRWRRRRASLGVDAGGREPLLGFIDKAFQHFANIAIGLGLEQDTIALEAEALGFGIRG